MFFNAVPYGGILCIFLLLMRMTIGAAKSTLADAQQLTVIGVMHI
jgi:hypothetical protein